MKNILSVIVFITFSLSLISQNEQTHVPASKSIIGIWRQTGVSQMNGKTMDRLTGNYKVINADSTYFTFVAWPEKTVIEHYGTCEITSDSTLVEHIVIHSMNSSLNGTDQFTRFKLINENTIEMGWSLDNKNWVNEKWTRLPLSR